MVSRSLLSEVATESVGRDLPWAFGFLPRNEVLSRQQYPQHQHMLVRYSYCEVSTAGIKLDRLIPERRRTVRLYESRHQTPNGFFSLPFEVAERA